MVYLRLLFVLCILSFLSSCGCKLWPRSPSGEPCKYTSHCGACHGTTALPRRAAPWDLPRRPPAPHRVW